MSLRDLLTEFYSYTTWIPNWLLTALMLATAAGLALAVHRGTVRLAHRLVSPERKFLQSLISATDGPIRMALVVVAIAIVLGLSAVNYFGTRWGATVQNVTVVIKVGFLGAIICLPLLLGKTDGRARVLPDDPGCSILAKRILSKDPAFRMPPGNVPLLDGEICDIVKWLADGAKDN